MTYQQQSSAITARKKTQDDIIKKYEWIQMELANLDNDEKEIQEQIENLDKGHMELETNHESEENLLQRYKEEYSLEETALDEEQKSLSRVREICENEFKDVNEKISFCINFLKSCSQADLQQPCNLKKPNGMLKRTMAAICILLEIDPDMIPDPSSKKKDAEEVADYWGPGKRRVRTLSPPHHLRP